MRTAHLTDKEQLPTVPQQRKGKQVFVCVSQQQHQQPHCQHRKNQTRETNERQTRTASKQATRTHLDTALRSHDHPVRVNLEVLERLQLALVHDATQSLHQHVTPLVDNAVLHRATRDVAHLCVRVCVRVFVKLASTALTKHTKQIAKTNLEHKRQTFPNYQCEAYPAVVYRHGAHTDTQHTPSCEIHLRENG